MYVKVLLEGFSPGSTEQTMDVKPLLASFMFPSRMGKHNLFKTGGIFLSKIIQFYMIHLTTRVGALLRIIETECGWAVITAILFFAFVYYCIFLEK